VNIAKKTKMLGAAIATLVTIAAAVPASADTFRAAFYGGDAAPGVVSVDYRDHDGYRFDRMRYEQERRAMFWRYWAFKHHHRFFERHMDHRFGNDGRFER